jgi:hypothetical protein
MGKIIATYLAVVFFVSFGSFGVTALLHAKEMRDPMQPPPLALEKMRQAKLADQPKKAVKIEPRSEPEPLRLTEIIYSKQRKIAIINDQLLVVGDRVGGARLVKLTRDSARLVRHGKVITLRLDNGYAAIQKKPIERDL